jgi:ubiquinone/menaquinone biosynthesis C-methylase UbiE
MSSLTTTTKHFMTPEELFDSIGPAYEIAFTNLRPQLDSINWITQQIQDSKPARVLDLGCGTGRPVCSTFAEAGHDVIGVDISDVMLADARSKCPLATFIKADVFEMELPVQSFDAITVFFSLSAGSSQDLIRRQINRMYRWLKFGGSLVLATVPSSRNQVGSHFMGRPFVGSGLSQEEYLLRIQQAGFEIVQHSISSFEPKAVEAGICKAGDSKAEPHLFIYAKKS